MPVRLFNIFFWGFLISFLGSLPLGSLNLITTYLTISKGATAALAFSAGCILSEFIFVRVAITWLHRINQRQKLFKLLEWSAIIIILVFAIYSIGAAIKETAFSSAMPAEVRHPFWSGFLLSSFDPMRIPFWFTWSTFLIGNKVLVPANNYFNYYVAGIAAGSLLGFLVFIFGGTYFIRVITGYHNFINWTIGGILLLTAGISIFRSLNRKPPLPAKEKNKDSSTAIVV